jgi:hypothetical protein
MNVIRGLLFDNLGLKFVALLLAVLIYLNVYTDRQATMVVSFPLQITELGDSLSLSGPVPAAIRAELRGTGKQLIRLRLREPMVMVSLANVSAGKFERAIGEVDLPLGGASGPALERLIGPLLLDLHIDRRVRHSLPVAARVDGAPAEGHAWTGEVLIEPGFIIVNGPREAVAALDSVVLATISIEGARDTVSMVVTPAALPDWCVPDPGTVRVSVPVVPAVP